MSARAFAEGVRALLGDPLLSVAVNALLPAPVGAVLRTNVPLGQIPAGQMPCWVVEQGDGRAASISSDGHDGGLVIGHAEQQFASDVFVTLVWQDNDRDRAALAREELPTLVTQLLLRNPQPGGIAGAWLADWQPDRGALHPLHVWRATLRGEYAIYQ